MRFEPGPSAPDGPPPGVLQPEAPLSRGRRGVTGGPGGVNILVRLNHSITLVNGVGARAYQRVEREASSLQR